MYNDIVKDLDPLFNPKSVAHIGATNNRNKWGFSTITSLINTYKGPIYPVNSHEEEIQGLPAFKKVTDIPGEVDLAVFTIPSERVAEAMEECVQKGVKSAVIISAGFAEIGPEGKKLQDEVQAIARRGNIRFIGPNCMGYWSASSSLAAFMMPLLVKDGPIAFVSQGGNVGAAVVVAGYERGVGFRRYVSCGCAADIPIEDYIEYFGRDPEVKVIMTYIEGISDGVKFTEVVKRVTQTKPVIVLNLHFSGQQIIGAGYREHDLEDARGLLFDDGAGHIQAVEHDGNGEHNQHEGCLDHNSVPVALADLSILVQLQDLDGNLGEQGVGIGLTSRPWRSCAR